MYIIQDQGSGQYWGRGKWWFVIHNATLYRQFHQAESAADRAMTGWGDDCLAKIVRVKVQITPWERTPSQYA